MKIHKSILPVTELPKIISAIVGVAANPIKNKLERNTQVIKLLKGFNFEPDHPPADFAGVYAYSLVEYGVGKPQAVLELFEQDEIRKAFRQAFEQNDPSILLNKGQEVIDGYAIGDTIKEIGVDLLREFATFSLHFLNVTGRTRNPAEVVTDQKLDTILNILEPFTRLKNKPDILLEFALQLEKNKLLESDNNVSVVKVRQFILSQQVRTWFTALKYEIESYNIQENTYFELIIRIPGRRGYDRVLVRGVEGEAKVPDVEALQKSVEKQKTQEGWLVAHRRISPAARDEAKKPENQDKIFCYTFDELIDQDANFDAYLDWLEAEVTRKEIDKMYVPLACTKDEFNLITQEKIAVSKYGEKEGWIEGYIDRWLGDPSKEHISILGEFGTGKTWITLHYAWIALQKYKTAKEQGIERPRIPLVIPLRDYAKAVSIESLFSEFFFRKYEIPLPSYSAFEQLNRMGKLLLIFDGFDEMADRVDEQKMINNFWELARVVVPGSKAILTSRTEHFPEAKSGRKLLNAELKASISALTGEPPQFEVVELEKFNDEQIRQVLSFRTNDSVVEEIMGNPQLLDLARRPVMTELILEALPEIEAGKPIDMSRIYLYAVKEKMRRDIRAERTFTSLADKLYFLCELSWEMLSTDQMSLNYRLFPERLRRLFGYAVQEEKNLDHWHYDMMGQTMLIRNADGDYTPAHRTLLEFFVAYKFAAELGVLAPDFLELAKEQSGLNQEQSSKYTWSSYFQRQCNKKGVVNSIAPLDEFLPDNFNLLVDTIGKEPLMSNRANFNDQGKPAIVSLIRKMLSSDKEMVKERLLSIIKQTRNQPLNQVGSIGGNIATILTAYDKNALIGQDLHGVDFSFVSLPSADLSGCNLEFTNLSNALFGDNCLMNNTKMQGCQFKNVRFYNTSGWFSGINLSQKSWNEVNEFSELLPTILYVYPNDCFHETEELDDTLILPKENEILITYIEENKSIKWQNKIYSVFILKSKREKDLIYILTIEGDDISINIQTGELFKTQEKKSLKTWLNADFKGIADLSDRDVYVLKTLGAINLPDISYDPRNDSEINVVLRHEFENNQEEDIEAESIN